MTREEIKKLFENRDFTSKAEDLVQRYYVETDDGIVRDFTYNAFDYLTNSYFLNSDRDLEDLFFAIKGNRYDIYDDYICYYEDKVYSAKTIKDVAQITIGEDYIDKLFEMKKRIEERDKGKVDIKEVFGKDYLKQIETEKSDDSWER